MVNSSPYSLPFIKLHRRMEQRGGSSSLLLSFMDFHGECWEIFFSAALGMIWRKGHALRLKVLYSFHAVWIMITLKLNDNHQNDMICTLQITVCCHMEIYSVLRAVKLWIIGKLLFCDFKAENIGAHRVCIPAWCGVDFLSLWRWFLTKAHRTCTWSKWWNE